MFRASPFFGGAMVLIIAGIAGLRYMFKKIGTVPINTK